MPETWRKYLTGMALALAGGTVVGWIYGYPDRGLLIAALLVLAWHVRHLLLFERALRMRRFDDFGVGEGIWPQLFSRFSHLKQRSRLHKKRYGQLLKEVRKSTNAMPDGGIVLNSDFEIVLCNKAAKTLVGFKRKVDRGQRVDNILRDPVFVEYLKSKKYPEGVEVPSPVIDGHWLFCRLVPYGAGQTLLLIRDITESKRLSMMRREFAANASHELRSPLTVISGYLDTMTDDPDAPEHWTRPLQQMQAQATRMNNIVSELLELSQLEGSGLAQESEVVDIAGLLAAARKSYADRKGVATIHVEIESAVQLLGNVMEIESVVSNLLANAVRHTPADGSITLRWRSDSDGALLEVVDTGEGVAAEHLPRLTERFFRVDSGRSRDDGGMGLGLAIVKHALGRHEADLKIESRLGEGSRFSCTFPVQRLHHPTPVSIAARPVTKMS